MEKARVIVVLVDYVGRQIIGEALSDCQKPVIKVKDPLIIREVVDQNKRAVNLSISPIFHTFEVPESEIKWTTKFIADQALVNSYDEYVRRIKAKRSNIEVVSSVPANIVPRVSG